MILSILKQHDKNGRLFFSLFLLFWFSVTSVGMLAADLKSSHPDCKCGCQSGQGCQIKRGSCCQKEQAGCCCSTAGSCCQNEPEPPAYRADCQCGRNSLDQIVLSKPYNLGPRHPALLNLDEREALFDKQPLLPEHQDAPITPPPELI